jgi:hypothetical protein
VGSLVLWTAGEAAAIKWQLPFITDITYAAVFGVLYYARSPIDSDIDEQPRGDIKPPPMKDQSHDGPH